LQQTPTSRFFKTLASHTIVFGLSTLVRPLSQLLLVRLHTNTHFISVDEYAGWSLLQVALNIGIVILNLGIATAFFRHYLLASTDDERDAIVGNSFKLTMFAAVFGAGILFLTGGLWSKVLLANSGFTVPARDIAIAIFGNTLSIIPLAFLRAEGRWKMFLAFNLMRFFSIIGLNVWFLIDLDLGLRGITLALAVTNIATALMIIPVIKGRIKKSTFMSGWKTLLRYGVPLIAIDITLFVLNGIPQIMLRWLHGSEEVALFGFGMKISFIAQFGIMMPFTIAFAPQLFRAKKEEIDPRPLYARTMGYIWTIAAAIALYVTLFSPELALLLGKNKFYHQAIPIVAWLALSVTFYGVFIVFSSGASLKDKTWVFPIILLVSSLLEFGCGWYWIRDYGIYGAAWAVLAGFISLAVFTYIVNQRIYPIAFPWLRVIKVGIVTLLILAAIKTTDLNDYFLIRLALAASFPVLLLLIGFFDEGECAAIKRWMGRITAKKQ